MYICKWILRNNLDLKQETSFYYARIYMVKKLVSLSSYFLFKVVGFGYFDNYFISLFISLPLSLSLSLSLFLSFTHSHTHTHTLLFFSLLITSGLSLSLSSIIELTLRNIWKYLKLNYKLESRKFLDFIIEFDTLVC